MILLLSRQILGGPRDDGRSSYQVAVTVCEHCRRGFQQARGELVEISVEAAAMAACDAQMIGGLERSDIGVNGMTPASSEIRSDAAVSTTPRLLRAKQLIPPAVRRAVLRRDGGRCQVPGCRHATVVDVHHLELRSEGGGNDADNLITLCSAHHRAVHDAALVIGGTPSLGLRFAHADGTIYGGQPAPAVAGLRAKACRALRLMGFGEKEAKSALVRVPADPELNLEQIVRRALQDLARHWGP